MRSFVRQNTAFSATVPPALLLDNSAGKFARELWWTNQEISTVDIIPPWLSVLICHVKDEQ
jgi:hypothetical protein